MKITKIQSTKNNNQSSINTRNSSCERNQNVSIRQDLNTQPSFQGLNTFVSRLFRKNNAINTIFLASETDALKALAKQDYGAYGLTSKGYKFITGKEFLALSEKPTVKEIIIKHPQTQTLVDTDVSSESFISREGVTPSAVIDAINRKLTKMTFMTDNELHVLTFPKRDLTGTCDAFEDTGHITAELEDTIHVIPEKRAGWLYEHAQNMLDETSAINHGIKLEKFPLVGMLQESA